MFTRSAVQRRLATVLMAALALTLTAVAAFVTSVIMAAPASAHATLIRITPARDARLTTPPTRVTLEFNEPVSAAFATVVVTNATGGNIARGIAVVLGDTATQMLSPHMASGDYRVAYRVTSSDGHPISGESTFTLTLNPETSSPTAVQPSSAMPPVPIPTPARADSALTEGRGLAVSEGWMPLAWLPIAMTAGLIGVGAGVVLWARRRR